MPSIIKQKTSKSPGVIVFTHNEVLRGVVNKSKSIKKYLCDTSKSGEWIYGIHIQGDCSHLKEWPLEPWQSFWMWPDVGATFLKNIPVDNVIPLVCTNFMPTRLENISSLEKIYDLCIISRASSIKRIAETLHLVRGLLTIRPELNIVFIVPDARKQSFGDAAYVKQGIDKVFYELPRKLFSCEELKQLSFLSSSQEAFGIFPLSNSLIERILVDSKFMLLTSHLEGVPRVIAESWLLNTPCIVSKNLRSGLNYLFNENNSIQIDDNLESAASRIIDALDSNEKFVINKPSMVSIFGEKLNKFKFQDLLTKIITRKGYLIEGNWYLNDLHLNLACHGQKNNFQFMNNEKLFYCWIEKAKNLGDMMPTEDYFFGFDEIKDYPSLYRKLMERINLFIFNFLSTYKIGKIKRYIVKTLNAGS